MPIGYKPDPEAGNNSYDELKAGTYDFKVETATEKTFSTGTPGLSCKLLVDYNGRDVPCFVNLFYEKATWKLKTFLECIGLDYDSPPELYEIQDQVGRAKFKVKPDGYFDVASFLDNVDKAMDPQAGSGKQGPRTRAAYGNDPPPQTDDDAPPF